MTETPDLVPADLFKRLGSIEDCLRKSLKHSPQSSILCFLKLNNDQLLDQLAEVQQEIDLTSRPEIYNLFCLATSLAYEISLLNQYLLNFHKNSTLDDDKKIISQIKDRLEEQKGGGLDRTAQLTAYQSLPALKNEYLDKIALGTDPKIAAAQPYAAFEILRKDIVDKYLDQLLGINGILS